MTQPAAPRRRKVAEENREKLLQAAEDLFAQRGLGVTLNDVARHAGVGVGTAYRRFANKEELIDALFEKRLSQAVELANESLQDPDAWNGLASYLDRSLQNEVGDRGMSHLINNVHVQPEQRRVDEWRDKLAPLLEQLVERAKEQGTLRADIVTADAIFLRAALTTIVDMSRDVAPDIYRRYLAIILDGLRAHPDAPTPLPVPPPGVSDSHAGMASVRWTAPGE